MKEEGAIKSGLKQNVYYLLKGAASILQKLMLEEGNNDLVSDLQKFVNLLELCSDIIFGDAVYETNKRRETVLRKPEKLPDQGDLREIRAHILFRLKTLLKKKKFFYIKRFC